MDDENQSNVGQRSLTTIRRYVKNAFPRATAVPYRNPQGRITHYLVWDRNPILHDASRLGSGKTSEEAWRRAHKLLIQREATPEPETNFNPAPR